MRDSNEAVELMALRKGNATMMLQKGQCGLCTHFGDHYPSDPQIIQIRLKKEGPENLVEECAHPNNAPLHLMVTPISGCKGFEPAVQAQA
jgi:hypothetical protein